MSLGSDVVLTWGSISDQPSIPTDVNQLNDASGQKWSTTVGENFIKTTSVTAQNLIVKAAKISGTLTASQINTTGLIAESISAASLNDINKNKFLYDSIKHKKQYFTNVQGQYLEFQIDKLIIYSLADFSSPSVIAC